VVSPPSFERKNATHHQAKGNNDDQENGVVAPAVPLLFPTRSNVLLSSPHCPRLPLRIFFDEQQQQQSSCFTTGPILTNANMTDSHILLKSPQNLIDDDKDVVV